MPKAKPRPKAKPNPPQPPQVITEYIERLAADPSAGNADPALLRSVAQLANLLPSVKPR